MNKRLLIVTQKADKDDPILGFFHRWIEEFAKNFEKVIVVCLFEGKHNLPANVRVRSLGKEKEASKFQYALRFLNIIRAERKDYDVVFVHMNPIYVVLGGIFWKMWKKKVSLWYTHRNVDLKLRLAERGADKIFTASPESFQFNSRKVEITGHGIDVESFSKVAREKNIGSEPIRIICVGRISPIKNQLVLVETANLLRYQWKKRFEVHIIGSPAGAEGAEYTLKIMELIKEYKLEPIVKMTGDISPDKMPETLAKADLSVNLSPTGGLDKVVLEAMASGVPVMSSNRTFDEMFGSYTQRLTFTEKNARELATKIVTFFEAVDIKEVTENLKKKAKSIADVSVLINHISEVIKQ